MKRRPPFPADFGLILASQSPRRHSLLRDLGVPFRVVSSQAEEIASGPNARIIAETNARAKLEGAVLPGDAQAGNFILATDTVVAVGDRILGKAASEEEAATMLRTLSGRTHEVVSGVALARIGLSATRVASAVTQVAFAVLAGEDIEAYVASGEWRGKAGAYGLQGLAALYSPEIRGEYSNVIGLPLHLLAQMFRSFGFDLARRVWV